MQTLNGRYSIDDTQWTIKEGWHSYAHFKSYNTLNYETAKTLFPEQFILSLSKERVMFQLNEALRQAQGLSESRVS